MFVGKSLDVTGFLESKKSFTERSSRALMRGGASEGSGVELSMDDQR